MSTNTTNTNNGAGGAKSSAPDARAGAGERARPDPFASIPLPEPAVLERLANEFFLALPNLANGNDHPPAPPFDAEAEAIPTVMFPEGAFPLQDVGGLETGASIPASPPLASPGPLGEAELRAIAASLAGSTGFLPGTPGTGPTAPAAGLPPTSPAGSEVSPFAIAPTLPLGSEAFSFAAVPTVLSSPPTEVPGVASVSAVRLTPETPATVSGSPPHHVEGEKGASPAAVPVLPPELFSFPRVPAMPNAPGLQTVPNPPAAPTAPPASTPSAASPGAEREIAVPGPKLDAEVWTPPGAQLPGYAAIPSGPTAPWEDAVHANAITPVPGLSDLFSFPGVPGVQSAPSVPALPSSWPMSQSGGLGPLNVSQPSDVPSARAIALPGTETARASAQEAANSTLLPSGTDGFELRPDFTIEKLGVAKRPFDPVLIRRDFPILQERVHGRPLVWLDNAATTQKPNAVIERVADFYRHENSNIHRAAHELAARATDAYESAREKARRFLNASSTQEIIFVRGTTEGINLVAQSWGRRNVGEGDEVVITWLEHHANIVPWQMLCSEKGARLRVAPVNDRGEVILEEYERLLGPRTRIVAFSQVSNALGTVTPAKTMIEMAHRYGARVLLDAAQSVAHMSSDVQALDCDFLVFSGHKIFAPTGVGVVFGKFDVLEKMPPWQGGGNMILDVTFERTVYNVPPARFEAGTGTIADAVGLGAALDYVEEVGVENISRYEHELLEYATAGLLSVPGLRLIGTAREKAGVLSFLLDSLPPEEVGKALDQEGIAVRAGHHCAQPILRRFGVEKTVRPSLALYNTRDDIDALVAALKRIQAGRTHS